MSAVSPLALRAPGFRLLRSELRLIVGRRRNQLGLAVLLILPIIIAFTVKATDTSEGGDFIGSISGNGMFVALAALSAALPLFLPVAVSAVSSDAIAGEAHQGTLRYLLTVPVSRARLLAVKAIAVAISCAGVTFAVALVGLVIGWILFPIGDVTLLSGTQISQGEGIARLVGVCAYMTLCLLALAAIGLFFSTLTEQPLGGSIAVIILAIVSAILNEIPQLDWLHPYLFVHHWMVFGDFFRAPVLWDNLREGALVSLGYIVVFVSAAWAHFTTKDITS
ncbi:MAG: ABC transporter permease [Corynebacteriales bacterium]|nr:ABC transporter permease [Mycobacteriales bacterium]